MPISVEDLSTLDWTSTTCRAGGGEVLDWLLRDDLALASLFGRFREDPDLQALSNVNRAGKKLALYDDPTNSADGGLGTDDRTGSTRSPTVATFGVPRNESSLGQEGLLGGVRARQGDAVAP